jgi:hypothetical protein
MASPRHTSLCGATSMSRSSRQIGDLSALQVTIRLKCCQMELSSWKGEATHRGASDSNEISLIQKMTHRPLKGLANL